ncbi:hypothetical protein EGR_03714 [Echinococcus granulosus]|uniref:Uncharacterized protein n=1 Tax=Echinococcus granulosus TaxID=6210 RepID=W6V576_ECHGR|nr:hypothetical protein EGR_03714 [Echinococcus granulosus]EUB61424.1 hypothetical protein EGR_03714 [Echinococcus granulosus]
MVYYTTFKSIAKLPHISTLLFPTEMILVSCKASISKMSMLNRNLIAKSSKISKVTQGREVAIDDQARCHYACTTNFALKMTKKRAENFCKSCSLSLFPIKKIPDLNKKVRQSYKLSRTNSYKDPITTEFKRFSVLLVSKVFNWEIRKGSIFTRFPYICLSLIFNHLFKTVVILISTLQKMLLLEDLIAPLKNNKRI